MQRKQWSDTLDNYPGINTTAYVVGDTWYCTDDREYKMHISDSDELKV